MVIKNPQMQSSTNVVRAAFVRSGGGVEVRKVELPRLEEGSVVVRMESSGICGTDLEKLTGKGITSSVLGHEVSGTVTQSTTPLFSPGDRVVPHHHVSCNSCELCLSGAETMCESFRNSNFAPGGFADEFHVPAYNVSHGGVHTISSKVSFEEASFAEPLGCCIRGQNRAGLSSSVRSEHGGRHLPPNKVLIVGAGPIGLLHMELLRALNKDVNITAVDVIGKRLEFAERYENANLIDATKVPDGAFSESAKKFSGPLGYDFVIVATGNEKVFGEALRCVRKSGTVLLFGAPHKGASHQLDMASLFLNEQIITTSYSATDVDIAEALHLLEEKRISVAKFVTGRYPLEKIDEAFASARSEGQVKVLINSQN
jgi:L-iditol 2-dehydrogenase